MVLLTIDSSTIRNCQPEDLSVDFESPIEVESHYEIALISCSLWYSWYNISTRHQNNILKFYDGMEWKEMRIPDGMYDCMTLNYLMKEHFYLEEPPIQFQMNEATLRFGIKLENEYQIDLTKGKLYELLGFPSTKIEARYSEGSSPPNITMGVDRILIHCSIVRETYLNNQRNDIIYSFTPSSPPGSLIEIEPTHPIYLPLKDYKQITQIRMKITDQRNRSINLNGEHVSYMLNLHANK